MKPGKEETRRRRNQEKEKLGEGKTMRKRNLENRGTRRRRNKEREKPWEMEKTGEEESRRWVNKEKKKTREGENRKKGKQ